MIITIDGSVGTGKSTVAKEISRQIGFIYFDTGAMYRCLTYKIMKDNIDYKDPEALQALLDSFKFDIKMYRGNRKYLVDNEDVTDAIRMQKVTSLVSEIAAIPQVRKNLVHIQRQFAVGVNAVFEGRDMGTVVFPDAEVKVFLTGRVEVRAKRRLDERLEKYPEDSKNLTLETVIEQINKRDHLDSTREISPLKQPDDALVVDTSDLTIDEVIMKILEYKDSLKTAQD